ncbi:protein LIFEGUARD 4-like [Hyposmocoma kahamanoa]|uniref:protein LIFEGUARD 4-like n=1 Tax=Hyposmocoma kahamanoa TaxID=1477025 RepID=UPI000E6D6EF9|nr:protein LIFEGUARD 4-like [Hyposmocoma kahamanoa]
MVQSLVEAGIISMCIFVQEVKKFIIQRGVIWLMCVAFGIQLLTYLALWSCTLSCRRKVPCNYILLFIIPLPLGFTLGLLSVLLRTDKVLLTVIILAAVCLGLMLVAFMTKNFTVSCGIRVCCCVVLSMFGMHIAYISMLSTRGLTIDSLYYSISYVISLTFSIVLVQCTQLLMDGKWTYIISPAEYVFAASSLYVNIIGCFQFLLSAFRPRRTQQIHRIIVHVT